jgi:hypothetical protein
VIGINAIWQPGVNYYIYSMAYKSTDKTEIVFFNALTVLENEPERLNLSMDYM